VKQKNEQKEKSKQQQQANNKKEDEGDLDVDLAPFYPDFMGQTEEEALEDKPAKNTEGEEGEDVDEPDDSIFDLGNKRMNTEVQKQRIGAKN